MKYIDGCIFQVVPLSNTFENAFVDSDDWAKIKDLVWYKNAQGYAATGHDSELMHHFILNVCDFTEYEVHHKNENRLDNRKKNLELLTRAEHLITRGKQQNNSSGFKGVYWKKTSGNRKGSWVAQIGYRGERVHIGRFKSAEEAARAYDHKAKELYGKLVKLNFPYEPSTE